MEKNHTIAVKTGIFSPAYKKHITPWASKRDTFSKWVTLLNYCSCAPSACMPRIT